MKINHGMIDIETLDTNPTASIIQIGIVDIDGNYEKWTIDLDDSLKHGTISGETLKFWLRQGDKARASISCGGWSLRGALLDLNSFIELNRVEFLWSHATFDIPILTNAFKQVGLEPAWDFKKLRDLRTIEHFTGDKITWKAREGVHHDALSDAEYQIEHLKLMLKLM